MKTTNCILDYVEQLPTEQHLYRCKVCGRRRESGQTDPEMVHVPCPGHPVPDNWKPSPARPKSDGPGQPRRLWNFSLATVHHCFAGCPTCTQEEADARLAVCHACELYKPNKDNPKIGRCTHAKCGCEISGVEKFASKLFWRDQNCPLGKWPELPPS